MQEKDAHCSAAGEPSVCCDPVCEKHDTGVEMSGKVHCGNQEDMHSAKHAGRPAEHCSSHDGSASHKKRHRGRFEEKPPRRRRGGLRLAIRLIIILLVLVIVLLVILAFTGGLGGGIKSQAGSLVDNMLGREAQPVYAPTVSAPAVTSETEAQDEAPAAAAEPESEPDPLYIRVNENVIYYMDESITASQLREVLLESYTSGTVTVEDDHALKEVYDSVKSVLDELAIPYLFRRSME